MNLDSEKEIEVASPCVRNCCLNNDDICVCCFRHIDEILAWKNCKNSVKKNVVSLCEQRRKSAEIKLSQGKY